MLSEIEEFRNGLVTRIVGTFPPSSLTSYGATLSARIVIIRDTVVRSVRISALSSITYLKTLITIILHFYYYFFIIITFTAKVNCTIFDFSSLSYVSYAASRIEQIVIPHDRAFRTYSFVMMPVRSLGYYNLIIIAHVIIFNCIFASECRKKTANEQPLRGEVSIQSASDIAYVTGTPCISLVSTEIIFFYLFRKTYKLKASRAFLVLH